MTSGINSHEQASQFDELPGVPDHWQSVETSIVPELDLAQDTEDVQLQAEVVLMLSQMAKEAHIVVQLCTPQAFLLFQQMLQIVNFKVAQPVAQLLCYLAQNSQAAEFFAQHELLQTMTQAVASRATTQATAEQMAQTVRVAVSHCAANLPIQANRELAAEIASALKCRGMADRHESLTISNLQESLHTLSLYETLAI